MCGMYHVSHHTVHVQLLAGILPSDELFVCRPQYLFHGYLFFYYFYYYNAFDAVGNLTGR